MDCAVGSERSKDGKEKAKGTKGREFFKARFVSVSFIGKKVGGFLTKLSNKVDCFGRGSTQASNATKVDDAAVTDPAAPKMSSVLPEDHLGASDDMRVAAVAGLHTSASDEKAGTDGDHHDEETKNEEEAEEDSISEIIEDGIPHRVKSKVDSKDHFSVVEKGMVVRTLKKLQSTGSSLFNQPKSFASQRGSRMDETLRADQNSRFRSSSCEAAIEALQSTPSRDIGNMKGGSWSPYEASTKLSRSCAGLHEGNGAVERSCNTMMVTSEYAEKQPVPVNEGMDGNVKRLPSFFEDNTLGVTEAVAVHEVQTGEEEESSEESLPEKTLARSTMNSLHVQGEAVEMKNGATRENESGNAAVAYIASENVRKLRSLFEEDISTVLGVDISRKDSPTPNAAALSLALTPSNKEPTGASQNVENSETIPMSVQQLSKHLSGRVERIRSLFEYDPRKAVIQVDRRRKHEKPFIRQRMACVATALSGEEEHAGMKMNDLEEQSGTKDAIPEDMVAKVDKDTEKDENRAPGSAARQLVCHRVNWGVDVRENDGDEGQKVSCMVEDEDESVTRTVRGAQGSSSESSQLDIIYESTSRSFANSEDHSHAFSNVVGRCVVL